MIVFDASVLVSATFREGSTPELALRRAFARDVIAISRETLDELLDVLFRPRLQRLISPEIRTDILNELVSRAVMIEPRVTITDCRDPADNIYLELALSAGAHAIVTGDADLLVLDPWRGVRIMKPADYLAARESRP